MRYAILLFLLYPILAVAQTPRDSNTLTCESCPPAPEVQQPEPHVRLWTFRPGPDRPPLYSNKGLVKSKLFWGSHLPLWGVMILACRNQRSGEEFHSEIPAVVGVTLMDALGMKYFSPSFGLIGPAIGIPHYIKANSK